LVYDNKGRVSEDHKSKHYAKKKKKKEMPIKLLKGRLKGKF
jgi:hypothetical protein